MRAGSDGSCWMLPRASPPPAGCHVSRVGCSFSDDGDQLAPASRLTKSPPARSRPRSCPARRRPGARYQMAVSPRSSAWCGRGLQDRPAAAAVVAPVHVGAPDLVVRGRPDPPGDRRSRKAEYTSRPARNGPSMASPNGPPIRRGTGPAACPRAASRSRCSDPVEGQVEAGGHEAPVRTGRPLEHLVTDRATVASTAAKTGSARGSALLHEVAEPPGHAEVHHEVREGWRTGRRPTGALRVEPSLLLPERLVRPAAMVVTPARLHPVEAVPGQRAGRGRADEDVGGDVEVGVVVVAPEAAVVVGQEVVGRWS
jgi:hypothetical protein